MSNKPESEGGGFKIASATPSTTPPQSQTPEFKPATPPPFKGETSPPMPIQRVHLKASDTGVAILGFSGSGKTVYLAMLYYATVWTRRFHEGWIVDWLALDGGVTDSYLKEVCKKILGISLVDGSRMFEMFVGWDTKGLPLFEPDPLQRNVRRELPKGTDNQSYLQFALTRSTGIRDHVLRVKTLDVKGEVVRRFSANPAVPKAEDLARDAQLKKDLQSWQQLKELCEQSSAILLLFNLLNWEGYDHTSDVNTLVGLLLQQPTPPRVLVFVVTGTDVLPEENEIERRRQEIIKKFEVVIERLEKHRVKWDVFMISNFGRGFTRRIPELPPKHRCEGKAASHICNHCQELVPFPDKDPEPERLAEPWEFIFEKLHRRWIVWEVLIEAWDRGQRALLSKAALIVLLFVLPLGFGAWKGMQGWQHARDIADLFRKDEKRPGTLKPEDLPAALAHDRALEANTLYQWLTPAVREESDDPHGQLRRLNHAELVYDDESRPSPERLKAAEAVVAKLQPPFAQLVPVDQLRLKAELAGVSTKSTDFLARLDAASKALGKVDRSQSGYEAVVGAAQELLIEIAEKVEANDKELAGVMSADNPRLKDETAQLDFLKKLKAALETGGITTLPGLSSAGAAKAGQPAGPAVPPTKAGGAAPKAEAVSPLQRLRAEVGPMIEHYTDYVDYVAIMNQKEETLEQLGAKTAAIDAFRKAHKDQAISFNAASRRWTELRNKISEVQAEAAYTSLGKYVPADLQENFASFAESFKKRTDFANNRTYANSPRAAEVRQQLLEMQNQAKNAVRGIAEATKRELDLLKLQDPVRNVVEWTTEVSRTERDQQALKDLSGLVKLNEKSNPRSTDKQDEPVDPAPVLKNLEQLLQWKNAYLSIVRRLADTPKNETEAAAQAKWLADFIQSLRADDPNPARRLAATEQTRLEDAMLTNQVEAEFKRLPAPGQASIQTPDNAFKAAIEAYSRFLETFKAKLPTPERQQKFPRLLEAQNNQQQFVLKQAEKKLWADITAGLQRRNPAEKDALLKLLKDYREKYPSGEKATEAQALGQNIDAWRVQAVRFKVDLFQLASPVNATLKIAVRAAEGGSDLVSRTFAIANGQLPTGGAAIEFNWSNVQDVDLEVTVSSGGRDLLKETRRVHADKFREEMTLKFPRTNGVNVKLSEAP